jgi:hypothetical protein
VSCPRNHSRDVFGPSCLDPSARGRAPRVRRNVSIQVLDRAESEDPPLRAHHGLEPMAWPRARCKTNCE